MLTWMSIVIRKKKELLLSMVYCVDQESSARSKHMLHCRLKLRLYWQHGLVVVLLDMERYHRVVLNIILSQPA